MSKNRTLASLISNDTSKVKQTYIDSDVVVTSASLGVTAAAGTAIYSSADTLPASADNGDQAFVTSTNRLYIYTNGGWYNIALINSTPYWSSEASSSYDLSTTGASTVITILAVDSEGIPIVYTATADSDFNQIATLSRDSDNGRTFTIIPTDSENGTAVAGTGTVTFKASDGVNLVSTLSTFSLTFGPNYTSATESILRPSSNAAYDYFGSDIEINSDATYAIIGSDRDTQGTGTNKGAAYVYTRSGSTWTEQAKLIASDTQYNDYFGCSVSISEDGMYAIAGAFNEDGGAGDPTSRAGAAYIYVRSGSSWSQQAKLIPSNVGANYDFGWAVSMSGDGTYVLVGAKADASTVSGGGAVYVFTRSGSTWTQQTKLEASDLQSSDGFGWDIEVNSDATYAIIASRLEDGGPGDPSGNVGAAYIFTRSGSTWTEQARLNPSIPNGVGAGQVNSVSMNSDCSTVVLGASYHASSISTYAGLAYIFTRSGSTWTEQAVLEAPDGGDDDAFGLKISMSSNGNYVAISAYGEDGGVGNPTSNSGAAYVFERDGSTWSQQTKLTASDTQAGDRFGSGIGISGDASYIIVGANEEDGGAGDPLSNAGVAYVYEAG